MPDYYKNFRCIADKCSDCCCIGWEIDIDNLTAAFYEKVDGDFGKRLKSNITHSSPKCFILDDKERCPFLNENNLCDIITCLGEDKLCQICRDHPRYFEWFDNLKEGGIGLSCEEAARIILSQSTPFSYFETEIPEENSDEYNYELFYCLFSAREKIITHLQNTDIPFRQRICDVLYYADEIQFLTDNNIYSLPEIKSYSPSIKADLYPVLELLLTLEPIDNNWIPYLNSCIDNIDNTRKLLPDFSEFNPQIEQYLTNLSVYFVWRYFLKGVFDGEFLSKIKLMAVSIAVIGFLFVCKWKHNHTLSLEDCAEIAKNYSKEIEYCEENIYTLADASYEFTFLSTENIAGLFLI